jgi:hypothetical protein
MAIDAVHVYAAIVSSAFVVCALFRLRSPLRALFHLLRRWTRQHLLYPYLVGRHRFFGPWSRAAVVLQVCFVLVNAFCIAFRTSSIHDASRRAGRLALLNLVPAYGSAHLSFLADICGVSLRTIQTVHRSAGTMALPLLAFHVAATLAARTSFSLRVAENMWGLVVSFSRAGFAALIRHQTPLTVSRVLPPCASSCSSPSPSSVVRRTRCSFECTNRSP